MARMEENCIFVGGLTWNTTARQLEDAFARFGVVLKSKIMLERETGRPRGYGFITFADQWAMEDAISEMHGWELHGRVISVNKAQRKKGGNNPGYGDGWDHTSGGRDSYRGGGRPVGQSDCFRCGCTGHFSRECPGGGGGQFSPHSMFGGGGGHGDRFGVDSCGDLFYGGRNGDRDHVDGRDSRYRNHDQHNDRYPPGGHFAGNRCIDQDPQNEYGKDRRYNRKGGPRGGGDKELQHIKKRQEDTHDHLKAFFGDALINCDMDVVSPEITVCSRASSFLPSAITEGVFNFEIPNGHPSASLTSNSVSIIIDNSLSPAHTLVQIVCQDHKGLLYDIMRTLKDYDIKISYGQCASKQKGKCELDLFIVQADGKKIADPNKQNELCSRLRMELLHPLRVAVVSRGPNTELLVANPVELSGKGRPLVFYDISLALEMLNIGIVLAETGRHVIGDQNWEVYRVLLDEGDSSSVPREKIEEGVLKMLMGWE